MSTASSVTVSLLETPSRSDLYDRLSLAFGFPDPHLYPEIRDGRMAAQIGASLGRLPYRLSTSSLSRRVPATYDALQSEYIRLFQVGGKHGPPCPLHEGHYTRDRGQTLRDLVRFYNHFGFQTVECIMPDDLSVQLEFMSVLVDGDDASHLRAQRDFLASHLTWTAELARRVIAARPHPFYRSLTVLTATLIDAEQRFLTEALKEPADG
jgi:DMSO reductase family type II enzyme chaperone